MANGILGSSFFMDKNEFTEIAKAVREAERAIGKVVCILTGKQNNGKYFSRSLYMFEGIEARGAITEKNVRSIRPGFWKHPKYYKEILNRRRP